jgi:DNA end-binding protein Ku
MPSTVWKGSIAFGLVSFPVRLFTAARAERVPFHLLHRKDLSRIKEVLYCADEDRPIERADTVRGLATEDGNVVVVEDAELKRIAPRTASTMDILQFVQKDEVDPIYFESSYYVAPEGQAAKAFSLFMKALESSGMFAIAKMAMHNREHIVLMRPTDEGLMLHTLFYPAELNRENRAEAPKADYTRKELALAMSLIEHLRGPFEPESFRDEYRENVERLIEQKRKGTKVTAAPKPRKAKVVDLMEALQESLRARGGKSPAKKSAKRKRAA